MENKKNNMVKNNKFSFYKIKKYKAAVLTAMIAGVVGAGKAVYDGKETTNKTETVSVLDDNDSTQVYVDYVGNKYSDKFGNLARIKALKPQIMAVIYAIEGFSENTFSDGHVKKKQKTAIKTRKMRKAVSKGTPTVGSGFTVLYDENGNRRAVKAGEKLTFADDVMYNSRYIDMELVPVLGDSVGRSLSDEEILCSIGLGYCWGTTGFKGSEFYKSLQRNDDVEVLGRKISGWRTPVGILKRGYLCEQVLKGCWTAQDLLDLPVYQIKDKGFVHCSIYTLDFHWYMPCEKDKKGEFVKDKNGNDVPKIMKDDFCEKFYADHDKMILSKLKNMALQGEASYKTVRDFMAKDLLAMMEEQDKKDKVKNLAFMDWSFTVQRLPNKGGR
ncbi:MAG: hypothetical protein J6C85_01435 [Alphaproteobacteria bacterium]|nr:hypothetical protein [Alphaproteobacteria bacterium]